MGMKGMKGIKMQNKSAITPHFTYILVHHNHGILLLQIAQHMHTMRQVFHDNQLAANIVLHALLRIVDEARAIPTPTQYHVAQLMQ